MKITATVFQIAKLIVKGLLFIVLLPFVLVWLTVVYIRFRIILVRQLVRSGMPKEMAKKLAKDTNPLRMLPSGNKHLHKPEEAVF